MSRAWPRVRLSLSLTQTTEVVRGRQELTKDTETTGKEKASVQAMYQQSHHGSDTATRWCDGTAHLTHVLYCRASPTAGAS